ncbi:hypothetical Protein YC6258_02123 [Gynuella sunshinyii YC6258]|uniref:Uncharacterized protein n=1 Tax=Gynuella sunshinyii YC6258 TaxID=1445510 RepID=A0A0C5VIS1_9GAMM|nr:hypothetical Protein YC6258_02123 [Gynuella sunshinyii YC6258]
MASKIPEEGYFSERLSLLPQERVDIEICKIFEVIFEHKDINGCWK